MPGALLAEVLLQELLDLLGGLPVLLLQLLEELLALLVALGVLYVLLIRCQAL